MLTGMQHVGVIVSDMEKSLSFYTGTLGLKKRAEFEVADEMPIKAILGVSGARMRVAMVQHGEDPEATVVELIEFLTPKGEPFPTNFRYNNIGITHVAFRVTDIVKIYDNLLKKGIEFNCYPITIDVEGFGVIKAAYFKDPDGITIELMEY